MTLTDQLGCAARTAIVRTWGRQLQYMSEAQLDRFDAELDHEVQAVMRGWRK
jgi:hypothetical protein